LLGTHLPWRDVLHEGPVPAGASLEETSAVRAQYLGSAGYGNPIRLAHDFSKRDAVIAKCDEYEEVVLWFEHDLFDQLQLLQILHYLGARSLPPGAVQLIQTDDFLGLLSPEELIPLQNKRRPVNAPTFKLASEVWDAFREPSPERLVALQERVTSEMRHLHGAIRRLFEEFPATGSGLARSEMQILDTVALGTHRKDDIFRLSQLREEAVYLGDASFFRLLEGLCDPGAPLLERTEAGFALTPLGKAVHSGERDWLEEYAIDRWIGGVHLRSSNVWRWDAPSRRLTR
jgi:hypothetical protein